MLWRERVARRIRMHDLGLLQPGGSDALRRARDRHAETSTPSTCPAGPTLRASSSTVVPLPQPMSITRSPGCGAAKASSRSVSPSNSRSIGSWRSAQQRVAALFQYWTSPALSVTSP